MTPLNSNELDSMKSMMQKLKSKLEKTKKSEYVYLYNSKSSANTNSDESKKYFDSKLHSAKKISTKFKFITPGYFSSKNKLRDVKLPMTVKLPKYTVFNVNSSRKKKKFADNTDTPPWWTASDKYSTVGLIEYPIKCDLKNHTIRDVKFLSNKQARSHRINSKKLGLQQQKDKIIIGALAPKPERIRKKNLSNIINAMQLATSTLTEKELRQKIQERLRIHNEANKKRQLTVENAREKKINFWKNIDDHYCGIMFKIMSPLDRKFINTLNKAINNYHSTGRFITTADGSYHLIFAEGSPRSIRKLKTIVLVRSKLNSEQNKNSVFVVSEWKQKLRTFESWKVIACKNTRELPFQERELYCSISNET